MNRKISFDIAAWLEELLRKAAAKSKLFVYEIFIPRVSTAADMRYGNFQANGVLSHAKKLMTNPRILSGNLLEALHKLPEFDLTQIKVTVSPPGFINFTLKPSFLLLWLKTYPLKKITYHRLLGRKIVIDYPSPNAAKQMHIGHLRPICIGSAVHGLLQFNGANVTCDNHIGDWGTNLGTLIMMIKLKYSSISLDSVKTMTTLSKIEHIYKIGTILENKYESIRNLCREELVKLQNGDTKNITLWKKIVSISNAALSQIYNSLGVTPHLNLGESFYQNKVKRVYKELTEIGLAQKSKGALVVFHTEHPRFCQQPFIIRKQDGASNYATIDLATLLYRVEELGAEEIVYVTDSRQLDHFEQLFITAKKWFIIKNYTIPKLEHVWFGTLLGKDGKAIKTRTGDNIHLPIVLYEAVSRASTLIAKKNTNLDKRKVSKYVGIGAIRYADLYQNRTQDSLFSWKKFLTLDGSTAPYLQYAVARIYSIFSRAGLVVGEAASLLQTKAEINLAHKLVIFPKIVEQAVVERRPHLLCVYLYNLAVGFSTFYKTEKVLNKEADVKARRLLLCTRTLSTIKTGLKILGIKTLKQM